MLPNKLNDNDKTCNFFDSHDGYLDEAMKFVLHDSAPGKICQMIGYAIETILKTRPENEVQRTKRNQD